MVTTTYIILSIFAVIITKRATLIKSEEVAFNLDHRNHFFSRSLLDPMKQAQRI